jgi:hypothetical protein
MGEVRGGGGGGGGERGEGGREEEGGGVREEEEGGGVREEEEEGGGEREEEEKGGGVREQEEGGVAGWEEGRRFDASPHVRGSHHSCRSKYCSLLFWLLSRACASTILVFGSSTNGAPCDPRKSRRVRVGLPRSTPQRRRDSS